MVNGQWSKVKSEHPEHYNMNEIDFRQLRRQERKNARLLHQHHCDGSSTDRKTAQEEVVVAVPEQSATTNHPMAQTIQSPYQTLLKDKLSEYYRIHPPGSKIDSVHYAKYFLTDDICKQILRWLQTLPEYSRQSIKLSLDERDESRECNGQWTTLKHAKRRGTT